VGAQAAGRRPHLHDLLLGSVVPETYSEAADIWSVGDQGVILRERQ